MRRPQLSDFPGAHQGGRPDRLLGVQDRGRHPDSAKPTWEELSKFDGKQFTNAGSGWRLTNDMDMKPALGGKAAGFRRVAFRFTALSGDWRMDDLYVDPRRRI